MVCQSPQECGSTFCGSYLPPHMESKLSDLPQHSESHVCNTKLSCKKISMLETEDVMYVSSIKCYVCESQVEKQDLSLHLFFGKLKCFDCGMKWINCKSFNSSFKSSKCAHKNKAWSNSKTKSPIDFLKENQPKHRSDRLNNVSSTVPSISKATNSSSSGNRRISKQVVKERNIAIMDEIFGSNSRSTENKVDKVGFKKSVVDSVSQPSRIKCYVCDSRVDKHNMSNHLFFGKLKCTDCGLKFRTCQSFDLSFKSSTCGHQNVVWSKSTTPIEFLEKNLSKRYKNIKKEVHRYARKLEDLKHKSPWKTVICELRNYKSCELEQYTCEKASQPSSVTMVIMKTNLVDLEII